MVNLNANADITIYNSVYDEVKDAYIYQGTVIEGVHWESLEGFFRRTGNNIVSSDSLRIMIPMSAKSSRVYIEPKEFEMLTDVDEHFTIRPESLVVRGKLNLKIESSRDLGEHYVITSVDLKDYGRKVMHHWDVIAK